ncbi:MAG: LysM peptidoglycan-binding domain-containing protein [Thermodesulfovibrionia bacterium]|nr:LysM peptidoglycan-binding domain-containing protein [Thermodesulfovibrionia bacterium]
MKYFAPINLLVIFSLLILSCVTPNSNYSSEINESLKTSELSKSVVNLPGDNEVESPMFSTPEIRADITSETITPALTENIASPLAEVEEESGQNLLDTALDFCNASQESWADGNFEEAIEALDQAYNMVLSVDTENNPTLIQQKEDLRFLISKRILEIYASRYTAVNGEHEAIPLILNKHVQREIELFQGYERNFFIESYKRSGRYREKIVKALNEAGMPEELSWLPLIESGFKVRALSSARALGLWQFIPSTGYKFGLKRDNWIDERMDPEKSTAAAIAYMTELHNIFGDWTTVLAAYNCGEGRVLRLIRDQSINYLDNFWDLYEKLPNETARYVPRFLATLHILKNPEKFGFTLEELDEPAVYETVTVEKILQLKTLASVLDVPYEKLADLNPELRNQATPSKPYPLRVPPGMENILLSKLDNIPIWYPPEKVYVYHKVKKGETLSLIASKYSTSVQNIARTNNLKGKKLKVGQKLKIPSGSEIIAGNPVTAVSVEIPSDGIYRVKKGDSLWKIASKFNTDTNTLKRINNMSTTQLEVGQVIKVTGSLTEVASDGKYRVKKGDSLSLIAKKFNTDTKALQRINNLQSTSLKVGQVLKIGK